MKILLGKQGLFLLAIVLLVSSLVSCSSDDYLNAVPGNSIAVLSVNMADAAAESKGQTQQLSVIKDIFKLDDVSDCGIDVTSKLYLFESAEGNIGLVAKVSDDDKLDDWLSKLSKNGYCSKTIKRSGYRFCTIKDSWIAGFSSDVMLIMGPVIASQQAAVRQQIIRYIEQDEDDGIRNSPLFDRLDSIDAPVAMVAQAAALPDKMAAAFTLGAPKDADASQVMVAAGMKKGSDHCFEITGETFSFNKGIDKNIRQSLKVLRPIRGKYTASMSSDDMAGVFVNVDGSQFINLLHTNKAFQALLTGINTAVDMDNIIRSIDGDMAVVMSSFGKENADVRMSAQLGNKNFLSDVGYWKQSCPKGGRIDDWKKDAFCYTDGILSYCFGVTEDLQYYSGSTPESAERSVGTASNPLPQSVKDVVEGKRMCIVFNVSALLGGSDETKAFIPLVRTLLGDVNTIIYSVK